jgi:hypothetical protein
MKHSGLQKSISSIFDGAEPIKQETAPTVKTAAPQMTVAAAVKPQPVLATETPPVADVVSPIAATRLHSTLSGSTACANVTASLTAKPATRPQPVPKKKSDSHNTISLSGMWTAIKSQFAGSSKKPIDARQKKTLILGITLAVVFVVVLLFALGSGPSGAKATPKSSLETSSSAGSPSGNVENWQKPEIYPLSLRDPMKPSSNASKGDAQFEGEMTVRGIVYSNNKPSAIIADQIVGEGDVIVGVKIIKIGKDFVAFEKDGKRWQQQVRQ